jgi:hypothetical protein
MGDAKAIPVEDIPSPSMAAAVIHLAFLVIFITHTSIFFENPAGFSFTQLFENNENFWEVYLRKYCFY